MRLLSLLVGLFIFSMAHAQSLPKYYCVDMYGTTFDDPGAMYVSLESTADGGIKLDFLEGWLKGRSFTGGWDDLANGDGYVYAANDELFGTQNIDVKVDASSYSTITIVSMNEEDRQTWIGAEGSCTVDHESKNYCVQINNQLYDLTIDDDGTGVISGGLSSFPLGPLSTFSSATVSSGGLELTTTTTASENLSLEFVVEGIRGTYSTTSGTYDIAGVRDPFPGGGGCSDISVSGSKGAYYYSTPTIVNNHIYIGSGSGSKHPLISNNHVSKINVGTMKTIWKVDLSSDEVRGSPVLDSVGNVYVVVERGRTLDTSGAGPLADHTASTLHLYKIVPPSGGSPASIVWTEPLSTNVEDISTGQISPAIGPDDTIYVGGDALHAFRPDQTHLWTFTRDCGTFAGPDMAGVDFRIVGSPLVYASSDPDRVIFTSTCGIHAVFRSTGAASWEIPLTDRGDHTGSPQWARSGGTVHGIIVPFDNSFYCLNPSTGNDCVTGAPATACTITPISVASGAIRGGPLLDSSGNIYFGTKNDGESSMFKVASYCSSTTPTWEYNSGSDLYPTGVINSNGQWIVANENLTRKNGTVNVFDISSATPSLVSSFNVYGDPTWPSLRIHSNNNNHRLILAVTDGSANWIPGLLYSIRQNYGYDTNAWNYTARGSNENTGR